MRRCREHELLACRKCGEWIPRWVSLRVQWRAKHRRCKVALGTKSARWARFHKPAVIIVSRLPRREGRWKCALTPVERLAVAGTLRRFSG